MKNNRYLLGKVKFWQTRLAGYIAMVNFVMVFYLYILESPLGLEWYHWLVVIVGGVIFLVLFDTLYVLPGSLSYQFIKNPEWNKHMKLIEEIKENQKIIIEQMKEK